MKSVFKKWAAIAASIALTSVAGLAQTPAAPVSHAGKTAANSAVPGGNPAPARAVPYTNGKTAAGAGAVPLRPAKAATLATAPAAAPLKGLPPASTARTSTPPQQAPAPRVVVSPQATIPVPVQPPVSAVAVLGSQEPGLRAPATPTAGTQATEPPKPEQPKPEQPKTEQPKTVPLPASAFESAPRLGTPAQTNPAQTENTPAAPIKTTPLPASPATGRSGTAGAGGKSEQKRPYVIGPLDILDIRVWNDPKMSGIFDVRPDGIMSMPLIGEFRADGMTVAELREAVVTRLSDLINAPEVNIQVARINSKRFYIFGEVGRAGEFPLIAETTILDALSNCGGFREFANLKKIYVLRGAKKLPFNFKEVSQGKRMEQNITLESGDRIFVP